MSDRRRAPAGVVLAGVLAVAASGCQFFGAKLPPGLQACVEVPVAVCGDITQSRINERAPVALTAYQITCVVERCTEASGEAEFVLNWADGLSETARYAWAAAGS